MRPTIVHSLVLLSALVLASPAQGIVGGDEADEGEYPWLGYLSADYLLLGSSCGGSLVAPTVFVTAAHCVEGLLPAGNALLNPFLQSVYVHLGSNQAGEGERIRASEIHIHPEYNGHHDIAVLILSKASGQQPIAWAQPGDEGKYAPGQVATVAGWGATSEGGSTSDALLEVHLPIISDAQCAAYYGSSTNGEFEVCAGVPEGGKDSCQGDSGGPLMVGTGRDALLIGVVSWGEGCARAGVPGVYAEVAALSSFIEQFA